MYRDKVKALEELVGPSLCCIRKHTVLLCHRKFMRYYAQVPAQRETSSHRNQRSDRRSLRGRSSDEIDDSDDSGTGDDDDSRDEASGEGGGEASEDSLDDVVNSFGGLLYEERDRGERDYGTSWFMAFTAERVAKQDANGPKRELFAYLDSPLEFGDDASVGGRNILEWWAVSDTIPSVFPYIFISHIEMCYLDSQSDLSNALSDRSGYPSRTWLNKTRNRNEQKVS